MKVFTQGYFFRIGVLSLALFACSKKEALPKAQTGVVSIIANDEGFVPSSVVLEKGKPASLQFTRKSENTCADKVVFPDLKIEKVLPMNETVSIEIPTGAAAKYTFQCGMGMFRSSVVVRAAND